MAIASSASHCGIFSLKQVDEIKEEIDNWDSTSPGTFRPTHEVSNDASLVGARLIFSGPLHSN
jgi:hypothetical protein